MSKRCSFAWSLALAVSAACGGGSSGGAADAGAVQSNAGSSGSGGKAGAGGAKGAAGKSGSGGAAASSGGAGGKVAGSGTAGRPAAGSGGGGAAGGGASGAAAGGGAVGGGGLDTSNSVLERNKHASRDGLFVQPTLTKANVMKFASDTTFKASFTGNMWASPLYFENGPNSQGAFFAVTTGNDVYALDESTGSTLWKKHLGDSPTANGVNCGSIHPLGILSTPIIDQDSGTIYVAGAFGTSQISRHELHALSTDTGDERPNWPLDVSTLQFGSLKFNPPPQNQRSALSMVNGVVYVAYGGHVGDCGDYHGWVVGADKKDPSKHGAWATLGRGEAIWAAGGMASDGKDLFAVTGNSTSSANSRMSSDSEAVVRLNGLAQFERDDKNIYYPAHWQMMDSADADFGASSPVYVRVPGSTPEGYVVAIAKDGHMYLLDPANLGGMGGHKVDFSVASGSMNVRTVPAAYSTSQGVHVVFTTLGGAKCPSGSGAGSGSTIMSVHLAAGSPPKPEVAWCAAYSGGERGPIVTTTDGVNEAIVWIMDGDELRAIDGENGKTLWTSAMTDTCSGIRKWTSPIAVKGRIIAGGDDHLCSWSAH